MQTEQVKNLYSKLDAMPIGTQVSRFLDYLVVEAGLSENTILGYGRDLMAFAKYCQGRGINEIKNITPNLVYAYLRHLSGSKTFIDTIKDAMRRIKSFLSAPKSMTTCTYKPLATGKRKI